MLKMAANEHLIFGWIFASYLGAVDGAAHAAHASACKPKIDNFPLHETMSEKYECCKWSDFNRCFI